MNVCKKCFDEFDQEIIQEIPEPIIQDVIIVQEIQEPINIQDVIIVQEIEIIEEPIIQDVIDIDIMKFNGIIELEV